jgi:hypothetical protein
LPYEIYLNRTLAPAKVRLLVFGGRSAARSATATAIATTAAALFVTSLIPPALITPAKPDRDGRFVAALMPAIGTAKGNSTATFREFGAGVNHLILALDDGTTFGTFVIHR